MAVQLPSVTPIRRGAELSSLVEAVLFSVGRPVSVAYLADALKVDEGQVRRTLSVLQSQSDSRGISLSWDGNRAELVVNPYFEATIHQTLRDDVERSLGLVDEYLDAQEQRGRRPRTIESYGLFLRRFAVELGRPIDEADTRDIRRFLAAEKRRGNQPSTIASKIHRLSSLYGWLEREEIIERNPMRRIDAPKLAKKTPKWLTQEEIEQVREVARGMDKIIFETLYSSGLRVSEAVALDWPHMDLNLRVVTVLDGKGGKDRETMLSTRAAMILRRYRDAREDNDVYVFRSQFRRRMSKESIWRRMRILGEKAGLKGRLTPHRLRHSFARHLREAGMPPDVIQAMMGHKDIRTTQGYSGLPTHEISHYYRAAFQ